MNRIDTTFQRLAAEKREALIAFLTAGDPDYDTSLELISQACSNGVDIIELGVPFSDPTADGPVIQAASERALKNGMSLHRTFQLANDLRQRLETPIVVFSYYNLIFKYGLQRTAQAASDAGVDGFLIVDLPPEEAAPFTAALEGRDIHIIRLIAPTTTPERMAKLDNGAGGFLYLISRTGVTGTGGLDYGSIAKYTAEVKKNVRHPVCLGFGISSGADAGALAPAADGLIVGSALVRIIAENLGQPDLQSKLLAKISDIRSGMDNH